MKFKKSRLLLPALLLAAVSFPIIYLCATISIPNPTPLGNTPHEVTPHDSLSGLNPTVHIDLKDGIEVNVTSQGKVMIRWSITSWKKDQVGFRLLRRQQKTDGTWEQWVGVGPNPIVPDFRKDSLEKMNLQKVIAALPQWKGEKLPRHPGPLAEKLAATPRDFPKIHLLCSTNFQWAQAFGMAWIDEETTRDDVYEYSVAVVLQNINGTRQPKEPFAQATVTSRHGAFAGPPIQTFIGSRRRQKKVVQIEWTVAKDRINEGGKISGWIVYRSNPGEPFRTIVSTIHLNQFKESSKENVRVYRIGHFGGDDAVQYAIAPFNTFESVGQISQSLLVPRRELPFKNGKNVVAKFEQDRVRIDWEHEAPMGNFQGYRILRKVHSYEGEVIETRNVLIPNTIPRTERCWFDDDVAKTYPGATVAYTIEAISSDYRRNVSSKESIAINIPQK